MISGQVTAAPTAEADRDAVGRMRRNLEVAAARRIGGPTSSASSLYTLPSAKKRGDGLTCLPPSRRRSAVEDRRPDSTKAVARSHPRGVERLILAAAQVLVDFALVHLMDPTATRRFEILAEDLDPDVAGVARIRVVPDRDV